MRDSLEAMLDNPIMGYAHHEMVLDDKGVPVDYRYLEANNTFRKITGLGDRSIIGSTVRELIPDITKDKFDWIGFFGNIALTGNNKDFEQYSDALGRWYRVHAYSNEKGFFSVIFVDITEDKKNVEILEGFFTVNLDLLCIADLEGNFIKTNEAWSRVLGYSTRELNTRKFLDFVHPDDLEATYAAMATLGIGNDVLNFTNRYQARDGSWRYIEWRSHPIGKLIYAAARDVTERIMAESEVKKQETNFRTFFDSMVDLVIVSTPEGKTLYANASLINTTGYSMEELAEMPRLNLHPPAFREEAARVFGEMLAGRMAYCTLPVLRKDGSHIPVETRVSFGEWDGQNCVFGIIKDMSAERDAVQKLDALFEINPSMMSLSSFPDWRYVQVNNAFLQGFAEVKEHIIGKNALELGQIDSPGFLKAAERLLKRDGRYRNLDLAIKNAQGESRNILASADLIRVANKDYVLSVLTDITKQKEMESELAREKTRLARIIEGTNVGTWEWNVETGETIFNERWARMMGYCLDELEPISSQAWTRFAHPDDLERSRRELRRHFSGETDHYEFESRMRHRNGHWIWVLDRGKVATRTADGKPLLMMGTSQDITTRKEAQETVITLSGLQQILVEISTAFINVPLEKMDPLINDSLEKLGIFTKVDRSYIFDYNFDNNTCSNTYEWCREGIEPQIDSLKNFPLAMAPDLASRHRAGETIYIPDVFALPEDDSTRQTLELQGIKSALTMPLMDGEHCLGFTGFDAVNNYHSFSEKEQTLLNLFSMMLVNLLKRNSVQKELVEERKKADEANKAKSRFLANMSHEIRTPLNGVIGFSELLKKTRLSGVQLQYAESAYSSGLTLLAIINDILDFSKIEAGMLSLETIRYDIIDLLESSIDIIKYAAGQKQVEVLLSIEDGFPRYAHIDPVRLKQILANLLGNAVKFTEKGEIELSAGCTRLEDGKARFHIAVRDTGIGISEAQKSRLFVAFSQADSSTTRKYGGTGLGLVISNMIAEKMGSSIKVQSGISEGSVFSFDFVTSCEDGEKLDLSDLSHIKRCMVIDDNLNSRIILARMLEGWGLVTESFDNGLSALKRLETAHSFDVIICDYHMPWMNGIETITHMRQKLLPDPGKHPVILLHSSSDEGILHEQCKSLGILFMLTKPVKSDELFRYLAMVRTQEAGPVLRANLEETARPGASTGERLTRERLTGEHLTGEHPAGKSATGDGHPGKGKSLLVAEDIPINMMLIKSMLASLFPALTVYEALNGREAVELNASKHPDIILMDVQMPEMDGLEASRLIREKEKKTGDRVRIIALTAGAFSEERDRCMAAGMDDFLTKPVDIHSLGRLLYATITVPAKDAAKPAPSPAPVWAEEPEPAILPERLEGIDMEEGLRISNQDGDFYLTLLREFEKELSGKYAEISRLVRSQESDQVKRLVHSLKGTSGMLGMGRLSTLCQKIELLLNNRQTVDKALLRAFDAELETVASSIRSINTGPLENGTAAPADDPGDGPVRTLAGNQTADALRKLIRSLERNMVVDDALLISVVEKIEASSGKVLAKSLLEAIDKYDYSLAIGILEKEIEGKERART